MIELFKKLFAGKLTPFVISQIRTYVPIGVGMVVAWANQEYGLVVDSVTTAGMATFVTGLAAGVYYSLARLVEKRWPRFGWLLGYPSQPSY